LIIDGHLDLAWNALVWNRDITKSVSEIRKSEAGMKGKGRAMNTVGFPEMRKGRVGVCLATLLPKLIGDDGFINYRSPEMAYASAQGQLIYYRALEAKGIIRIIYDLNILEEVVEMWMENPETAPFGFIISMEGADAIIDPTQLRDWWKDGLRVLSLSHYGVNRYAHGTHSSGGLTKLGRELLEEMSSLGMILDLTHLSDESFWEAIDLFDGPLLASHNNCRALVPGDRQFSDEQIKAIIRRNGVIGVALDAWMLYPGWVKGKTPNTVVSLEAVVDQISHIRDLAGHVGNIGIGSDLDGGFGREQTPHDLNTIADLQKIPPLLREKGYMESEIRAIMHGNWLRLFREAWSSMKI